MMIWGDVKQKPDAFGINLVPRHNMNTDQLIQHIHFIFPLLYRPKYRGLNHRGQGHWGQVHWDLGHQGQGNWGRVQWSQSNWDH
jgi:hypothetical protein